MYASCTLHRIGTDQGSTPSTHLGSGAGCAGVSTTRSGPRSPSSLAPRPSSPAGSNAQHCPTARLLRRVSAHFPGASFGKPSKWFLSGSLGGPRPWPRHIVQVSQGNSTPRRPIKLTPSLSVARMSAATMSRARGVLKSFALSNAVSNSGLAAQILPGLTNAASPAVERQEHPTVR